MYLPGRQRLVVKFEVAIEVRVQHHPTVPLEGVYLDHNVLVHWWVDGVLLANRITNRDAAMEVHNAGLDPDGKATLHQGNGIVHAQETLPIGRPLEDGETVVGRV